MWALAVMNTELLINWNKFEDGDGGSSAWQFGQVLPMFLVILPLINMIKANFHPIARRLIEKVSHNSIS